MAVAGVVGLGKLGLPVAVTLALRGHRVLGHDLAPCRMTLDALSPHERSVDLSTSLAASLPPRLPLEFVDLPELVRTSDCVFVAVATPHEPRFEGTVPLPRARADFDYRALRRAVAQVVECAAGRLEIGVMSTVMPGTTRRVIAPLAEGHTLVYCPQFVAMGTVAHDLCEPEFTLLGRGRGEAGVTRAVLTSLAPRAPVHDVSYESAELAKVLYNTFVSAKVGLSNTVQQLAHESGASAAEVYGVLRSADRRLWSSAYLGPGMGDGGPCHPRDNIALSWLARERRVGADLFSAVMAYREAYVEWLGERFVEASAGLPLVVLGTAYKPATDIVTGSSTALLVTLLRLRGLDPTVVDVPADLAHARLPDGPGAYFVGCPDPEFATLPVPAGSVIVDPWHRVEPRAGATVVRIGETAGR